MKLTMIDCERATPRRGVTKLSDRDGLQLWVQRPRVKHWRLARSRRAADWKRRASSPTLKRATSAGAYVRGEHWDERVAMMT
jgi:hypothetical protein